MLCHDRGSFSPEAVVVSAQPPQTSFAVLRQLLDRASEADVLDYKRRLDPNDRRDIVELAKDVAAMQSSGGHIVVGVDDRGIPSGHMTSALADRFDEAQLSHKLARYLPEPIGLLVARHDVDGHPVVLMQVLPSSAGFCVLKADGAYDRGGGRQELVFRQGDVFVRHGTRSERWQQFDVDRLFDLRLARERRPTPPFKLVSLTERHNPSGRPRAHCLRFRIDVELKLEVLVSDIAVYVRDIEPERGSRLVRVRSANPHQPILRPTVEHGEITRYAVYLGERYRHGQIVTLGFTEYFERSSASWEQENLHAHLADKPLDYLRLELCLPAKQRPSRLFRRRIDSQGGVADRTPLDVPSTGPIFAEYVVESAQMGEQYELVWTYD